MGRGMSFCCTIHMAGACYSAILASLVDAVGGRGRFTIDYDTHVTLYTVTYEYIYIQPDTHYVQAKTRAKTAPWAALFPSDACGLPLCRRQGFLTATPRPFFFAVSWRRFQLFRFHFPFCFCIWHRGCPQPSPPACDEKVLPSRPVTCRPAVSETRASARLTASMSLSGGGGGVRPADGTRTTHELTAWLDCLLTSSVPATLQTLRTASSRRKYDLFHVSSRERSSRQTPVRGSVRQKKGLTSTRQAIDWTL